MADILVGGLRLMSVVLGGWTTDELSKLMQLTEEGNTLKICPKALLEHIYCPEERISEMLRYFLSKNRRLMFGEVEGWTYVIIDGKHLFTRNLEVIGRGGDLALYSPDTLDTITKTLKL